ncbi:2492_t:CDS:1 [Dentiscutata erythropus]|uniref:2492_t:CDS:1 n=1 Tax=Dentiscutata erythropus TaxID=1348616 RepID=A0A9N8WKX1_9GLOM|nr:2492_t:CDS:1 [Dentiscutata erythropus]
MPRPKKVFSNCKNARISKINKSYKKLSTSINTNFINSLAEYQYNFITNESQSNQIQDFQQNNLQNIINTDFNLEKVKNDLITKINYLSEEELKSYSQLLINMTYKDGLYKRKIISPYLQKKAME